MQKRRATQLLEQSFVLIRLRLTFTNVNEEPRVWSKNRSHGESSIMTWTARLHLQQVHELKQIGRNLAARHIHDTLPTFLQGNCNVQQTELTQYLWLELYICKIMLFVTVVLQNV